MEKNLKKTLLGMLGERIIAKHLRGKGHTVTESLNVFDSEKDFDVDGYKVEVKTQVPFLIKDSFSISPNQLNKIQNSKYVYWVSVPPTKVNDTLSGYVFKMDPNVAKFERYSLKNGKEMISFKRNQPGMEIVDKIKDSKLLEHLKELSTSYL